MKNNYLRAAEDLYKEAAINVQEGLCCTTSPVWQLPDLQLPDLQLPSKMLKMNYGCGSTVHPRDLVNSPTVLYVGVGGGMELLQFSYFTRKEGGVIGIDVVDEMLEAAQKNIKEAEKINDWFRSDYIKLKKGDPLQIPIEDASIDIAAQNCLFNIFKTSDLAKALHEMYRVLKPYGRLVLSDPIAEKNIPDSLKNDERLRAMCLSGAVSLAAYLELITSCGFGTVEVRARRPYRIISPSHFDTTETIVVESVEICAIKDPMPPDGPCIFTGKAAIYFGEEAYFDDHQGHVLAYNQPLMVCDKTAHALASLGRDDIHISPSTYFYDGGGCC